MANLILNGIEGFWGYAKIRLTKFKGMDKNTFLLHLKETEFRYNNRNNNLYKPVVHLEKDCSSDINIVYLIEYQSVKYNEQSY